MGVHHVEEDVGKGGAAGELEEAMEEEAIDDADEEDGEGGSGEDRRLGEARCGLRRWQ